MDPKRGPSVLVWVLLILGVLIVVPLIGMFVMMATGGTMMGGGMGHMMPMGGWGLLWMVALLAVVVALVVVVIRLVDRG